MTKPEDRHSLYMQKVLDLAQELVKEGQEVPVAALIVKGDEIISTGVNHREKNKSILGHAEIDAIEKASNATQDWNLSGCSLYVNLEPCAMCAGAILQSHISEVVFSAYDAKSGALGSRYNLVTKNLKVTGGILEEESLALLNEFFKKLRSS